MALLVFVFVLVMVQLLGDKADWRLFEPYNIIWDISKLAIIDLSR
jgi:hypothetical protein